MKNFHVIAALTGPVLCGMALATQAAEDQRLEEVVVVATTPVPGLNVDADKVPGNIQTLAREALRQDGGADLIRSISTRLGSVNVSDTLGDPFQPDIVYRGFEASPVLGTPQGLAVYQNGVRINEAFGDTVNWDLFPAIALDRIDIVSANPLFGLNALGGALSVTMKNGFSYQGVGGELSGGSFNQAQAAAEFGENQGRFGIYGAAHLLDQNGWRLFAHDSVRQYYLAASFRDDAASLDLSYARADDRLFGQGAAPLQSLALDPRNVFTGPQDNFNRLNFVTLNGSYSFRERVAVQAVLYARTYRQEVANGNSTSFSSCNAPADAGRLCQADGTTPLGDAAGAPIPDISNNGSRFIGENDFERIDSDGTGGSLQFTSTLPILLHENSFALGATFDGAQTHFQSGTEVGVLNARLTLIEPAVIVATPEGTGFSATPVNLNANNKYYGLYLTDTFDVTSLLSVSASARYNLAKVDLTDQNGTALSGHNRFAHLNPALGATFRLLPGITLYAGYSTNNRTPTASEIECSDPAKPCPLPTNLAGDPPNLRQVIAHTAELGARWRSTGASGGHLNGNISGFRTDSADDIYGIASSGGTGFFQNIGSTRRQGFEASVNHRSERVSAYAQYSYIDATFRSPLLLHSPSNPYQDANGNIRVLAGKQLPLIPRNRLKLGVDVSPLPGFSLGTSVAVTSSSFYRADESNQNPPLSGYHPVSLRTSYEITRKVALFANVQNLFDERYSTYGLYSDPTGLGAPGVPPNANSNDPGVDNRFQSPAMPRSYFGGVRVSF